MRLNFFPTASSSELGNTGGITAEQTTMLNNLIVTATEINSLAGVTSDVQAQLNGKLNKSGGTITGYLSSAASPSLSLHAVTKQYVDTTISSLLSGYASTSGATLTGALALSANGVNGTHAVTKQQLDSAIAAGGGGGGEDLSTGFPTWTGTTNAQVGAGWATFQSKLQAMIDENRRGPLSSYSKLLANGTYPSTQAMRNGLLLADGRVFMVPYNSTTARIYDPVTDTLSTPAGTYEGLGLHAGGLLLKDGRVFIVPGATPVAYIYDPVADTLTASAANFQGDRVNSHQGYGVLLPDGHVLVLATGNSGAVRWYNYNPTTDTLVAGGGPTFSSVYSLTLLPDGKVFTVFAGTSYNIYDPVTNTGVNKTASNATFANYSTSILLPSGLVAVIGRDLNATSPINLYNPTTDTVSIPTLTKTIAASNVNCNRAILLPDGRVFCVPRDGTVASVYDPADNTLKPSSVGFTGAFGGDYGDCVLLKDGNLFLVPSGITTAAIAVANYPTIPDEVLYSPFFNPVG